MLTTNAIHNHLDDTTATRIAEQWNAAYPLMRTITTNRINAYRQQIQDQVWNIDPNHPRADVLRAYLPTEADVRRRLKNTEALRRQLHQLDNGTHRACTRSPQGFSTHAAYTAIRALLNATTLNDHGLAVVYRLAAALADLSDERHRQWAARTTGTPA